MVPAGPNALSATIVEERLCKSRPRYVAAKGSSTTSTKRRKTRHTPRQHLHHTTRDVRNNGLHRFAKSACPLLPTLSRHTHLRPPPKQTMQHHTKKRHRHSKRSPNTNILNRLFARKLRAKQRQPSHQDRATATKRPV